MPPPPNMPNSITKMKENGMGHNGDTGPAEDDECVGP